MKIAKFFFAATLLIAAWSGGSFAQGTPEERMQPAVASRQEFYPNSDQPIPPHHRNDAGLRTYTADGATALAEELLFRPLGLVTLICGTGLYVGMSPFTALASIPYPHDAFQKTAELLIIKPAEFTLERPLGDFNYQSRH